MGFEDAGLYKAMKETFPGSFHKCGKKSFYRRFGEAAPTVRIEDAPVRVHKLPLAAIQQTARYRKQRMAELGIVQAPPGVPVDAAAPLWFDAFMLFMSHVNRFYNAHANAEVYVLCWDRGTPPAKHLIHIRRYQRKSSTIKLAPGQLDALFTSSYIPTDKYTACMSQKGFVDRLGRHLMSMIDCYRPPHGKMFIVDGPGRTDPPKLITSSSVELLTMPELQNHCLEADTSILFYCTVFCNHNIEISTVDGDVLLGILLQTRGRITGSFHTQDSIQFELSNIIVLEKAATNHAENLNEHITEDYMAQSLADLPNEVAERTPGKAVYLERLGTRRANQEAMDQEFILADAATSGVAGYAPGNSLVIPVTQPSANLVGNEDLQTRCDIIYTSEGEKRFIEYEFININHLFQSIYDYSLARFDNRLEDPTTPFLPVEQFCAMAMLCGNDYVCKPKGIGAKFIFEAYFSHLDRLRVMLVGERANGSRATYATDLELHETMHMHLDSSAFYRLIEYGFITKSKRANPQITEDVRTTCANVRFSLNYFANDFKQGVYANQCFETHQKCGKSLYGYILPNKDLPPGQRNIGRTANVCECFFSD